MHELVIVIVGLSCSLAGLFSLDSRSLLDTDQLPLQVHELATAIHELATELLTVISLSPSLSHQLLEFAPHILQHGPSHGRYILQRIFNLSLTLPPPHRSERERGGEDWLGRRRSATEMSDQMPNQMQSAEANEIISAVHTHTHTHTHTDTHTYTRTHTHTYTHTHTHIIQPI